MQRDELESGRPHLLSMVGLLATSAWFGWVGVQARSRSRRRMAQRLAAMVGTAVVVQVGRHLLKASKAKQASPRGELPRAGPPAQPAAPTAQSNEQRLEEAMQETFPASDPVSIHIE
jgi:hypothetical protein